MGSGVRKALEQGAALLETVERAIAVGEDGAALEALRRGRIRLWSREQRPRWEELLSSLTRALEGARAPESFDRAVVTAHIASAFNRRHRYESPVVKAAEERLRQYVGAPKRPPHRVSKVNPEAVLEAIQTLVRAGSVWGVRNAIGDVWSSVDFSDEQRDRLDALDAHLYEAQSEEVELRHQCDDWLDILAAGQLPRIAGARPGLGATVLAFRRPEEVVDTSRDDSDAS